MVHIEPRDYQKDCLSKINTVGEGRWMIRMATGLGKTVVISMIPRQGKTLLLAHREELIFQPIKYFDCPVGLEKADFSSNGEEVVIASVQSMINRLTNFPRDYFHTIITDECHHASAPSYQKIYEYFNFKRHLGFTATTRGDGIRLDNIYDEIIFDRDLKWGIENGYLSPIECYRANIGYDLSKVHTKMGDFKQNELNVEMNRSIINDSIAELYNREAEGATMIFVPSVDQANEVAKRINGAVAITGKTDNRIEIIERFTKREINCIVSVGVFTEGTDIPLIETIIIARPTQNSSLYTQMVGRGLRKAEGKDKLKLIDCVGVTKTAKLCTAATLAGLDISKLPDEIIDKLNGVDFMQMEKTIDSLLNVDFNIIMQKIDTFAEWKEEVNYDTHNLCLVRKPNGTLVLSLKDGNMFIPAPDELGMTEYNGEHLQMQLALDNLYAWLQQNAPDQKLLWDLSLIEKTWGENKASDKQIYWIKRKMNSEDSSKIDFEKLSKLEASRILAALFAVEKKNSTSDSSPVIEDPFYTVGMNIKHRVFGHGTIIDKTYIGSDNTVLSIEFENGQKKKFLEKTVLKYLTNR